MIDQPRTSTHSCGATEVSSTIRNWAVPSAISAFQRPMSPTPVAGRLVRRPVHSPGRSDAQKFGLGGGELLVGQNALLVQGRDLLQLV